MEPFKQSPPASPRRQLTRGLRVAAALLVLLGGAVHLFVWVKVERSVPIIGPLFIVNVASAVVIAVALLIRPAGLIAIAALGLSSVTLAMFVLSRTVGIFGTQEPGVDAMGIVAAVAEMGTMVGLTAWFWATRPAPGSIAVIGDRKPDAA